MAAMGAPGIAPVVALKERERLVGVLGDLCGLAAGESAERCGRGWCGYFDHDRARCALLVWDVPVKLGPEALRWFALHRTPTAAERGTDLDDMLLARTCSF